MSKNSEKAKVKGEKAKSSQALEKGKMTFHNETTGEKITIDLERLNQTRIAVEMEFEPGLAKGNYFPVCPGSHELFKERREGRR